MTFSERQDWVKERYPTYFAQYCYWAYYMDRELFRDDEDDEDLWCVRCGGTHE